MDMKAVLADFFKTAAEDGYSRAQYNIGFCYERGWGVQKCYKEAFKWHSVAAEVENDAHVSKCKLEQELPQDQLAELQEEARRVREMIMQSIGGKKR